MHEGRLVACCVHLTVFLTMLPTCLPGRWINPLMGWTSTADPMENVTRSSMAFNTKEDAIAFATKHGWEVASVEEPNVRRLDRQKRYQGYGDKFRWACLPACLPVQDM